MYNMDVGKMIALRKAGWKTERIAAEMHIEPDSVDKAISEYMQAEEKKPEKKQVENEKAQERTLVCLTSEQVRDIYEKAAAIGAKEALRTFKEERKKEYSNRSHRRLHNTKLLLRNYHMLKEHAENSVFGRTQMEASALDVLESMMSLYDNEVIIESIKRSATRTAVIVTHIETMFSLYDVYCKKSPNPEIEQRRHDVLWDMYLSECPLSVAEIEKKYNISERSVYDDIKIATKKLSALIFGVDGLNVH